MGLPVVGKAHEAGPGAPFNWFIYGSSLDVSAFRAWAAEHGYQVPDFSRAHPAKLAGYRLAFDVRSRFWGGAVASLTEAADQLVEGISLPLPGAARGLVDHKEGAISGLYRAFPVEILVGDEKVPALAYRAADDRRLQAEEPPSRQFVETLIRGARSFQLSPEWISSLERRLG
jgi:hypothetical protein